MGNKLRIISRQSPLALLQVDEVLRTLPPDIEHEVIKVTSYGDRHKNVSLMSDSISPDFFTRELDRALLEGDADIAIHSAKDLPYPLPIGIKVVALTKGGDKSDSLVSKGNVKLAELPSGSRIGTSSAVRKAELLALRSDIEVVPIRGTIEERIAQVDDGYVDALIVATCALDRLGLSHRAAEKLPFKTHPLQGNLAITVGGKAPDWIIDLFAPFDIRREYGKVTLVGFGPGDPDLLTIKGYKALEHADVIFYDDLTNESFLNQFKAEKIYVGKRSGKHSHHQDDINELLYQSAIQGNDVVRLKGGDPMLFSHGREEVDFLRSRMVDVEIVPGISSGNALASLLQIPLTHRGVARSVAMVLGHSDEPQTPDADTLLYYMGGSSISKIANSLIESGRDDNTPVAIVTNVSLPNQRAIYSSLRELRYAIFKDTPVLLMIGNVVKFAAETTSQTTYDTGTQSSTPLIKITPTNVNIDTTKANWLVFTSRYGVRYFNGATEGKHIASVGPVTSAELNDRGLTPDFESPTESAEGLLEFFSKLPSQHIILPRSDKGLKALSDGLIAQGHVVEDIPVYTNRPNADAQPIDLSKVDKVIFSSPSSVEVFKNLYGNNIPIHLLLIAKGKTTYETIQTI
ncbi:MAG: uroporphyrinogen-III C-methyltransferase [Paludibacteraceae bacterium]|nr:uroporphyrinogen-III C-methyltransferase [Paludibacteraceae bacterium]